MARWPYPSKGDYLNWLGKLFADHGVDPKRAIFWLFPVNEFLQDAVTKFSPSVVVSDVVDDQRQHPAVTPARRDACEENYRKLLGISDLVVTNCAPIQKSMAAFARAIKLLPNACEIEPAEERPEFDLQRLLDIPQPRLGYVGNLESKLDLRLLEYVASQRPNWHIVLVGSAHSRPEVLDLKRFRNIHIMGVVPYDEARVWIRHFDVALIPHLDTPLTQSMNPLKLFVYLAQRVPVVSTPTPNTEELGDYMYVARDYKEFVYSIEEALRRKLDNSERLHKSLKENSWSARVDTAMRWINEIKTQY